MIKIGEIVDFLKRNNVKHEYVGKESLWIDKYSVPDSITDNSILWINNIEKLEQLKLSGYKNLLIVTPLINENMSNGINILKSENSKEVFFTILNHFFAEESKIPLINKTSTVESNKIGKNVYIGHNCYISPHVEIGDDVVINNNVVLEGKVKVGNNTKIYSGVIIGSDGYGYYQNENGLNIKVPHLGGVIIGENVDIGANTCIDRGTLGDTFIGDNVKIDNLCHIAHNVVIEDNVSVIALSMIAGSVRLKRNSYIAPSASIMNQLTVGRSSIVGLGAVVIKDVEDEVVVAGVPARVVRRMGE